MAAEEQSDMPCPFGCGYRPTSGRNAALHLWGHATGHYTSGDDQMEETD